ncbi:hypothetical protein [Algicella marina]|uniref:Lipoprotein n=1 Tax=Algicella marina TaxID=2683284 RepID=A0A6P1SXK9_9RHOB|nr:hypothetical protein [Algicella marina]QHQ34211.1 hypothetical protein GO499_02900 [Algicella marina]
MLRNAIACAFAALTLAACDGPIAQPVLTEAQFRQEIVGKTLSNGATTLRIFANGIVGGLGNSGPVVGTWRWEDGRFCRIIASGGPVGDGCQTVLLTGEAVTFIEASGGVGNQTYFLAN